MTNEEREKYLKAYYDNEADANKQMSFANVFGGIIMLILWVLYLTKVFQIHDSFYILVCILFPAMALILFTPLLYLKTDKIRKPNYKYFLLFSFLLVIAIVNVIIPKHGTLAWTLIIIMANHYYNPKLGRIVFFLTIGLMLICMYAGMFIGEYDPHLLGNGVIRDGEIVYPEDLEERVEMLKNMMAAGENRFVKTFTFYYIPRVAIITLLFLISNSLNKRTYNLLVEEIKVNGEQEKTKTELEVAKDIQLSTLPNELFTNEDIEMQAELHAAKEVGGDFYDYFILDNDHIGIVIGDVSGKGIPAAMFMMKTITCFKNYSSIRRSPAETLKLVNKTIYEGNDSQMFVTCFYAIINTQSGEMKFANAGHNPPIIGQNKSFHYLNCKPGFILGGFKEAFVDDEITQLNNGDSVTLYTDGITEARNPEGELYGEKRFLSVFNRKEYSGLVELFHTAKDDIVKFVNGAPQSDDITYLTIKYHGDHYECKEETFAAKIDNIPMMLSFLEEYSKKWNLEKSFVNNLLIVGDELLSNVCKYAYVDGNEGDVYLRLLYNIDRKELNLTIVDFGVEFNPFLVDNKPISGEVSKIKEGGLGILIVKNLMSEYAYDRINGKNIIILKKKF